MHAFCILLTCSSRHGAPPSLATWPAGGKSKIESDQATRDTLTSVLALHHLLPEPYYDATWTTPFFAPGVKLATLNKDADLTIGPTSSQGYIVLQGPRNSANILTKDVYACM